MNNTTSTLLAPMRAMSQQLDREDTRAFISRELGSIHCFSTHEDIVDLARDVMSSALRCQVGVDIPHVIRVLTAERFWQADLYAAVCGRDG